MDLLINLATLWLILELIAGAIGLAGFVIIVLFVLVPMFRGRR